MKTLICAALLAASLGAAPPNPVSWKIQGTPAKPVKPGERFTVKLVANAGEGWHFYSMVPMEGGPIATRIWLGEGQPFVLSGSVRAPKPEMTQDAAFGMEVGLYEGEQVFELPVQVAPSAAPGAHNLAVSMYYQCCDNRVCLPPRTITTGVPIEVRK